ncbi:MAG: sulfatase [Bacteroidales bacterium]|nr:sulfatase [Bacteroidales bacterium]
MNPRPSPWILFSGLTLAGCVSRPEAKPNIVLILAEDMSTDLSCYGMPGVRTPNLDRLASEGVLYTNARSCCPVSSPTRSAMMTGVHQTVIGSHNHRSNADKPLPEGILPFTSYLRGAGYECVLGHEGCFETTGFLAADVRSSRKIDCNFKYSPVGPYDGVEQFGLFDRLYEPAGDGPFFNQITLYVTHRADHWKDIRSRSAHPVDPLSVELPAYMADHPKIREEFACYLDQVEYMDSEVGMILEDLENKGVLDNTVIFFIGDNGRCDVRAKGYLYEDGTHIPMIVWKKGIRHAVVDDLVSELDITASILHLAGLAVPSHFQGRVLTALGGPEGGHPFLYTAEDTFDETVNCMRAVHTDRYTYIRNYFPERPYDQHTLFFDFYRPALHIMRALNREGGLTPAQAAFFRPGRPEEELYDYRMDRDCIHNLAGDAAYASALDSLRALMDGYQAEHRDLGLEDRFSRVDRPADESPRFHRGFVRMKHPEGWAAIEAGEICDSYGRWREEFAAWKKNGR